MLNRHLAIVLDAAIYRGKRLTSLSAGFPGGPANLVAPAVATSLRQYATFPFQPWTRKVTSSCRRVRFTAGGIRYKQGIVG